MGLGTIMLKHLTEKILTNRNKTPFGSRPVLARKYPPSRAAPSPRYPLKQCQEQWRPAVGTLVLHLLHNKGFLDFRGSIDFRVYKYIFRTVLKYVNITYTHVYIYMKWTHIYGRDV